METKAERVARVRPVEFLGWWLDNKKRVKRCSFGEALELYFRHLGARNVGIGEYVVLDLGVQHAEVKLPEWVEWVTDSLGGGDLSDYRRFTLVLVEKAMSWAGWMAETRIRNEQD